MHQLFRWWLRGRRDRTQHSRQYWSVHLTGRRMQRDRIFAWPQEVREGALSAPDAPPPPRREFFADGDAMPYLLESHLVAV